MAARESALAQVRAQPALLPGTREAFLQALEAAQENARLWHSEHPLQTVKIQELLEGLTALEHYVWNSWDPQVPHPWDALWRWGEAHLPLEAQEALLALLLEPHGALVDPWGEEMDADEEQAFCLQGKMPVQALRDLLHEHYGWALEIDYTNPQHSARFWYVSEEKLEPRLGERYEEPGAEREQPLDVGRQAAALNEELRQWSEGEPVATLLLARPHLRSIVRRVQLTAAYPFAEVHDNLIAADLLPIDLLRCKLAFFGATRFDPRSDRWVRISLFQNCPYPEDLPQAERL